jgi:hypothetical protein
MEELKTQITKGKCEKAPGESGVTPEAYKVMSMESKTILLKILCNVYKGRTDPDEWHEALAKCLHKKGDTSDPNNCQAMCLKDTSTRLMGGIMNARLIQVIQEHGVKTQFGSQPARTGMFGRTIHTAVSSRNQDIPQSTNLGPVRQSRENL